MPRTYLPAVSAFHRAVDVPRLTVSMPDPEKLVTVALRATLIQEEWTEYDDALSVYLTESTNTGLQHVAKELADLLYVTLGTADVLGLRVDDPHPQRHSIPLRVITYVNLKFAYRTVIRELTDLGRILDADGFAAFADAVDDLAPLLQELVELIGDTAHDHDIPLREVFDSVHRSNLSKLNPATGKPDYREDGKVLKGPGYSPPDLSFLTPLAA